MKKKVFLCGLLLGICSLLLPVTGSAEYGDTSVEEDTPYAYIANPNFRMELATQLNKRDTSDYLNYGLLLKTDISGIKKIDTESELYSLDSFKYLPNLTSYYSEDNYVTDYRPLKEAQKLEVFKQESTPSTSLEFLSELTNLKKISIHLSNVTDSNGKVDTSLNPILDLSYLDNLNKLESIQINEDNRYSSTITLTKGTTSYHLIDPVILSNHFDNSEIEYTSNDSNFNCSSNKILSWENLNPTVTELTYRWNAYNDSTNSYSSFTGETTIPIRWK